MIGGHGPPYVNRAAWRAGRARRTLLLQRVGVQAPGAHALGVIADRHAGDLLRGFEVDHGHTVLLADRDVAMAAVVTLGGPAPSGSSDSVMTSKSKLARSTIAA